MARAKKSSAVYTVTLQVRANPRTRLHLQFDSHEQAFELECWVQRNRKHLEVVERTSYGTAVFKTVAEAIGPIDAFLRDTPAMPGVQPLDIERDYDLDPVWP